MIPAVETELIYQPATVQMVLLMIILIKHVQNVMLNVKLVMVEQIIVLNVLQTELIYQLVHAHQDIMMMVQQNAKNVLGNVKNVSNLLLIANQINVEETVYMPQLVLAHLDLMKTERVIIAPIVIGNVLLAVTLTHVINVLVTDNYLIVTAHWELLNKINVNIAQNAIINVKNVLNLHLNVYHAEGIELTHHYVYAQQIIMMILRANIVKL